MTFTRRQTREVTIGSIRVGGSHPIRLQSMTTSDTRDTAATIEQAIRLFDAGCEIVRMTVQGMKEAQSCETIKNELVKRGYHLPLVADIHFFPAAALSVADFVDKVRINPGNFVDKRASFKQQDYTDEAYTNELERLEEKFSPLVEKCKRLGKAMRIGVNHGSLSDRVMNRYGDTPQGMVESAFEFARVCRKLDYHDFLFSMKSSNPKVMIEAYRLLVAEMDKVGWDYPLHLGVTEAGEGDEGRIKSAIGIGSLLLEGLGDTIRVSLTEDPWHEIDPCRRLRALQPALAPLIKTPAKREVVYPKNLSLHRDGSVLISPSLEELASPRLHHDLGCEGLKIGHATVDALIVPTRADALLPLEEMGMSLLERSEILTLAEAIRTEAFTLPLSSPSLKGVIVADEPPESWEALERLQPQVIFLNPVQNRLDTCRRFFRYLHSRSLHFPVMLAFSYTDTKEDLLIRAGAECGSLLCDGLGEGVWLQGPYPAEFLKNLSFNLLQSCRLRSSKTEFISCPSCGRTLFDLQEVSRRIRTRTAHLPGVKIAIMGCIVNGPGEMADADFGYVGSKPQKIDLYVGKSCVEKDIPFEEADEKLVALIKAHGRWVEPAGVL